MKVAVINLSGNTGKTTQAKHLLAPRLGVEPISIETINADEGGIRVSAKQFDEVQEHLLLNDVAIVDIGASNIEALMKAMQQYKKSHEDFDFFVVPVVKEAKQQKDTIATVEALHSLGVPAKKIRVVFNMVDVDESIEDAFPAIINYADAEKKCVVRKEAVIFHNDVFTRSREVGKTIQELLDDETDYRALVKTAKDDEEKELLVKMILAKRLAESAQENLDKVFKVLFK